MCSLHAVAAMAVIDSKLVPVLIEKLQTEIDELKVRACTVFWLALHSTITCLLTYPQSVVTAYIIRGYHTAVSIYLPQRDGRLS